MPRKPTVVTMLRLPADVRAWLVALAEREKRTITAQVLRIFEEWRASHPDDRRDP